MNSQVSGRGGDALVAWQGFPKWLAISEKAVHLQAWFFVVRPKRHCSRRPNGGLESHGPRAGGHWVGGCVCGGPQSSGRWVSLALSPDPARGSRRYVCVRGQLFRLRLGIRSAPWTPARVRDPASGHLAFRFLWHPWNLKEICKTPQGELKLPPHHVLGGLKT